MLKKTLTFRTQQQSTNVSREAQTVGLFTRWPFLKEPMASMKAFQSHHSSNLQGHREGMGGATCYQACDDTKCTDGQMGKYKPVQHSTCVVLL